MMASHGTALFNRQLVRLTGRDGSMRVEVGFVVCSLVCGSTSIVALGVSLWCMWAVLRNVDTFEGGPCSTILHHHLFGSSWVCHLVACCATAPGVLLLIRVLLRHLSLGVDNMLGWHLRSLNWWCHRTCFTKSVNRTGTALGHSRLATCAILVGRLHIVRLWWDTTFLTLIVTMCTVVVSIMNIRKWVWSLWQLESFSRNTSWVDSFYTARWNVTWHTKNCVLLRNLLLCNIILEDITSLNNYTVVLSVLWLSITSIAFLMNTLAILWSVRLTSILIQMLL